MRDKAYALRHVRLQFITHYNGQYSHIDATRMALEGGCRWIQLRMKETPIEEIEPVARQIQQLCREYDAVFIIDDHVELVRQLQADGVHLGKQDMPIAQARNLLGADYIIGGTANTFADIQAHNDAGADYIGCGPFRHTTTKKNLSPLLGLSGYATIIAQMRETGICLPLVAIGGITAADIAPILHTGADGIALSGSVLRATHPVEEMRSLVGLLQQLSEEHADKSKT